LVYVVPPVKCRLKYPVFPAVFVAVICVKLALVEPVAFAIIAAMLFRSLRGDVVGALKRARHGAVGGLRVLDVVDALRWGGKIVRGRCRNVAAQVGVLAAVDRRERVDGQDRGGARVLWTEFREERVARSEILVVDLPRLHEVRALLDDYV